MNDIPNIHRCVIFGLCLAAVFGQIQQQETTGQCEGNSFVCTDGSCVPMHWKCDGKNDCPDGSDEVCANTPTCKQFLCKHTHKCILKGWVCDDEEDCGVDPLTGPDRSDEDPALCPSNGTCLWNEARCGNTSECRPLERFCDGTRDCPDSGDELDFCDKDPCRKVECSYKCAPTPEGPVCYCPQGSRMDGTTCVDADECELDNICDQVCNNTIGSYRCSCVSGYNMIGGRCKAVNVPMQEEVSLLYSTQKHIARLNTIGDLWQPNSTLTVMSCNALEFSHRNRSFYYIHRNLTKSYLMWANVDNFAQRFAVPVSSPLVEVEHIQQMALDWVSLNWYFLDDTNEIIYVCTSALDRCKIIVEHELRKPRALALDPTTGFMFFTKWGQSPAMIERVRMDGSDRKPIITEKIIFPYGITIDYATKTLYWVDTYLDFIERIDYDGKNRKTVLKGKQAVNLYGISTFENLLYVSSWHFNSLIAVDKRTKEANKLIENDSRPYNVHVFHRQRQPDAAHPCKTNNGGCKHMCIPLWNKNVAVTKCICSAGYLPLSNGRCIVKTPSSFLLFSKSKPASIKGVTLDGRNETIVPILGLSRPESIDFDARTRTVLFANSHRIGKASLEGGDITVILNKDIGKCAGIAYDWWGGNLYWTDEDKRSVNVINLANTTQKRTLIQDGSIRPGSVAVSPQDGLLFWTHNSWLKSGKSSIEKAWMDGSHRLKLMEFNNSWASGLALDVANRRIYWSDAVFNYIESADFDGKDRRTVLTLNIQHPFGLAFYKDVLYFAELLRGVIVKYDLSSKVLTQIASGNEPLLQTKVYDPDLQTESSACAARNCPELCFPIPKSSVCACSDGLEYSNGKCAEKVETKVPDCPNGTFACVPEGRCIPNKYKCGGVRDCKDYTDERLDQFVSCKHLLCGSTQFLCDGDLCIDNVWLCDGHADCKDKSDEDKKFCSESCAAQGKFECKRSSRCIPKTKVCDGNLDCQNDDRSDEENCSVKKCEITEYTCKNKVCVPYHMFCDGIDDCGDNSDETDCLHCDLDELPCQPTQTCIPLSMHCNKILDCPDGSDEEDCTKERCTKDQFQCSMTQCISAKFRCDGFRDCPNGADEDNCTKVTTPFPALLPTPLTCDHPSRMCDNSTRCITVDQLCDEQNDCVDGSDEGLRCPEVLCELTGTCSHKCHSAPEGVVCYCPEGLHLQADKVNCLATHPCESWGVCSQKCQHVRSRYKCACLPGYTLHADGFTCKSDDSAVPYVIFSNRHELRGVDLQSFNVKALISSLKNTIAVDFYHSPEADLVFWTDVIDDKIYRGSLVGNSLSNIEVVVQTGLSTAEGLAVDWIGENLYWVESNLDQIEVAKLNGSFRRTLVAGEMESPRAIAVDPRDGFLFWTDWDYNSPRIERCSLAGLDRVVVIKVDQISEGGWPNGLTLDYDMRRIYWIDARSDLIHTTDYHGHDRHEVMRNHEMLSHPFAITLFENYVYWTDWRTNSVVRANKFNGGDVQVIQRTLTQPFDIQILHPSRQPRGTTNPCGTNNGGCSHLCLLHTNHTFKCDCPHVMRLSEDKKTCVVNERVLLFARANEIRGVDLEQPYYHTIPTISLPVVINAIELEYLAKNTSLYWVDSQSNEVKRTGLTSGPTQTLIDTGLEKPSGLAIDWIADLLFVSYQKGILVCNLEGEYSTMLVENFNILSIAANPAEGRLYWMQHTGNETKAVLVTSLMDGTKQETLFTNITLPARSLTIDRDSNRLYWISDYDVNYYDLRNKSTARPIKSDVISALTVYKGLIYYADDGNDQSIRCANKTTGENDELLRNNTSGVQALRIYDPSEQTGTNPCAKNKHICQHLCLPVGRTAYTCSCATGYTVHEKDRNKCVGVEEFLFYSINWEIKGLALNGANDSHVLGPVSRISMATTIDYLYDEDLLFWGDSDHGTVTTVGRDGTRRKIVVEQTEGMENVPVDWLSGMAVDWISKNLYWSNPKQGVIEVSRFNNQERYVLLHDIEKPVSLAVDPVKGLLVWVNSQSIGSSGLDGSNFKILHESGESITDVTLDYERHHIYWCDTNANTIERMTYEGADKMVLLNHSLENPTALVLFGDKLYWTDSIHDRGSIKSAPVSNISNFSTLLNELGDSLKDIQVFSKKRQPGTNPCAVKNGGCEQLCLYNGTHPVCACPHGRVAANGKSCEEYDSFVMYSRVVSVDSIHMTNATLQNAPYPSIKNSSLMRNAIGITFDYKSQRIFYSDIQKGSINTVHFNGTDHKVIIERQGSVEGISYEQVHNALYWTCNNDATISRVNLTRIATNATPVETVIRLRPRDKPRGIAVDSCGGRVYWTNWNSHMPTIERAFLTGFGRTAVVTTDIRMPNAVTLDHRAHKLYWADARLDKIERCEYDGSNRIILAKNVPQHPFALAVHGDLIFWTDWVLKAVLRADKLTGQNVVWLRRDIARPMGIIAVANDTDDCFSNPCLILNGGCEEHCSLNASGSVQCACSEGRTLAEDGLRCYQKQTPCTDTSFRCSDGGCVPFELTCDHIQHCTDGSDEEPGYCGHRGCPHGWLLCQNKRCVHENATCNGHDDCGDSSDEFNCTCSPVEHFRCNDGQCIHIGFRCDFDPDCRDRSDEMNCPQKNCQKEENDMSFMNCPHTTACVHKSWFCDGEDDCWDGSDEMNCTHVLRKCTYLEFKCLNGTCIDIEDACDGIDDCHDAPKAGALSSDEQNCKGRCRADQFACADNKSCILSHLRCNDRPECPDESDEVDCVHKCRSDQFKCGNGECIPLSWQCDGQSDCFDHSDESAHCRERTCKSNEFRCKSGRCIPTSWICDGEMDCLDQADEAVTNCPQKVCGAHQFQCLDRSCIDSVFYCDDDFDCADRSDEPADCEKHCYAGEFRCASGSCILDELKCDRNNDCGDGSDEGAICLNVTDYCQGRGVFRCANGACINDTLLCDGENNCGDFSDENKCNIDECSAPTIPCTQRCIDKLVGYECACFEGYQPSNKSEGACEDVDECLEHPCTQKCRNSVGSYHCSCTEGFVKESKNKCVANSTVPATLILANRYYIRQVELSGHATLLAHNLTNVVALDYDWRSKCIYWSDVTTVGSSIKRLCNTTTHPNITQVLHSPTLQNPDGLAVDWVAQNLYWCDKGLDTLEVSTLDGKFRRVIISKGLEEPRTVALHPAHGHLYWTDWGTHVHIGKAGMDGSNPQVIVNSSLGWPNALTIAYDTDELFWGDAREDYIAVADLDGRNVRVVASRARNPYLNLHHIFAIAVWEDYVYWSDWETKTVERAHKYRGDDNTTLYKTIHRPMDLRIVHPLRQPKMRNPCENANCSALCLLKPNPPYYTCACPENYVLGEDGATCVSNCTSTHFECKNTMKCIPFWWKCDTQNDCGDGSDEPADCRPFTCLPGKFQCNNSKCVHPTNLCDGVDDCNDGSDESNCDNYTCLNTQFKCPGNETTPPRCIPNSQVCNKQSNCPLGEDELNCPPATCPPQKFKCTNDKCIPSVWVCDKDDDCGDNSDEANSPEANCASRTCATDHFRCNSGRCIPNTWQCDGDPDCSEGEDEPASCNHPNFHTCEPTYFKCANNKCIPGRWYCDYENDCGDESDEIDCKPRNCSESEFRCGNGRCIQGSQRCDGEFQCDDKLDEHNCPSKCKQNEFQCNNPQYCIFLEWRCDNDFDCADGSDEMNCSDTCPNNGFKCRNNVCIHGDWRCDGQRDCEDGSDEESEMCARFTCPIWRIRCRNSKCVLPSTLCDGHDDCGDNSDEQPPFCQPDRRCKTNEFQCGHNGRCVSSELRCDGQNDCGNNRDEEDCSPCRWDSCPHQCVELKNKTAICKCEAGFEHDAVRNACIAKGFPAQLVIAAEAELRLLSPYKIGASNQLSKAVLATAPGYKVDAVDILYEPKHVTAYWSDHQNKRVQSMVLQINNGGRFTRGPDMPTILNNLHEPRGIAIDWSTKKVYVTDKDRIVVATLDGKQMVTLISEQVYDPRDIVVSPEDGLMFWTDWQHTPSIQKAYMDGNKRTYFVEYSILWPTGLTIDQPAQRLYWADPKALKVECIKFDGTDRQIVKRFIQSEMPYKLEVFEDNLFVTTYHTHNVLRMNKFGKGNVTYLAQAYPRISDVLIVQEHKNKMSIKDRCVDFCHPSEFCLLMPTGASCTCADGLIKDNYTCKPQVSQKPNCPLSCNAGTCKLVDGQTPKCICPAQYSGPHCEHYRCSQFCKNKGMCYVDLLLASEPDVQPPLRCNCPPNWTGERCETPVKVCDKLSCYNGGVCSVTDGSEVCKCPEGFGGDSCEVEACPIDCGAHGTCVKAGCKCEPGYSGPACDRDACHKHCVNGGTCRIGAKQPECVCPPFYGGRRCEVSLCHAPRPPPECARCQCQNGGNCVELRADLQVCECPAPWGGENCELYVGRNQICRNYCEHNGICQIQNVTLQPRCYCDENWDGDKCETPTQCLDYCQNGGSCSINDNMRYCDCLPEFEGPKCESRKSSKDVRLPAGSQDSEGSSLTTVMVALIVIILIATSLGIGYFFLRKRQLFTHERLQENDFNNPMYQERDAEPFALDTDKSNNFVNPVYETVYNGTSSGKEEKANLLQNSADEAPPVPSEEL